MSNQEAASHRRENKVPVVGKTFKEDEEHTSTHRAETFQSEPAQAAPLDIKQRLENLKKLFIEDEENQATREVQQQWSKRDAKPPKKTFNEQPKSLFRQSVAAKFTTEQETNEDRQTFLVKKIKQSKQRTDALMLPQLYVEKTDTAAAADGKPFKFQASVLTHIAEFKKYGQEYIENQFIDRQFREQTDYHYEKYQHIKIKQQARDAAKLKYIKPQETQTGLL